MRQVAKEFLSRSQVNECFARLKQRCSGSHGSGARATTTASYHGNLDSPHRYRPQRSGPLHGGPWQPGARPRVRVGWQRHGSAFLSGASELIVTFLEEHCARKTAVVAGSSLGDDVAILKQDLPTVHALATNAPIDVGRGGTARYAKLRERGLVPETKAALSSWESEHRAAQEQSDASSIDYLEASVVALGESRERSFRRAVEGGEVRRRRALRDDGAPPRRLRQARRPRRDRGAVRGAHA